MFFKKLKLMTAVLLCLCILLNTLTTFCQGLKYGDVNGDGNISAVDYVNIKNYIMGSENVIKNQKRDCYEKCENSRLHTS